MWEIGTQLSEVATKKEITHQANFWLSMYTWDVGREDACAGSDGGGEAHHFY